MDGQGDSYIPPKTLFAGGIIIDRVPTSQVFFPGKALSEEAENTNSTVFDLI
jgi:hypothetical protein